MQQRRMFGSRIVLVVEDDSEMRRILEHALNKEGYVAFDAHDGSEAVDFLRFLLRDANRLLRPELVVLDFRMPGLNGLQVLEELRALDAKLPVVLMTAFGDRELHAEARRLGASHTMDKPMDLSEFVSVVHSLTPPLGAGAN